MKLNKINDYKYHKDSSDELLSVCIEGNRIEIKLSQSIICLCQYGNPKIDSKTRQKLHSMGGTYCVKTR